jgi:hypothetical protein
MSIGLDPKSRRVLRRFLIRLLLCVWMLALVASPNRWPYRVAIGMFHLMCTVSALGAIGAALFRREKLNQTSLTLWEESLAFAALSLLMLFIWRETG